MSDEIKAALTDLYRTGYEQGKQFSVARQRENVIAAFVIGAMLGLLAGVSL